MIEEGKKTEVVKLVYFTGTGNTSFMADEIEKCIVQKDKRVIKLQIKAGEMGSDEKEDFLFVVFPVYGFNAPLPLIRWVDSLPMVYGTPAVVIANSGGGDVTPNMASNEKIIKKLEQKGYRVIYDKILVMPANYVSETPLEIAVQLIRILPKNIDKIINDVFSGVTRRSKPNHTNRICSKIGLKEQMDAGKFAKKIKVESSCTGCGLCSRRCPMGNIEIRDAKPVFHDVCALCLNCIYGCPKKALKPEIYKFFIIHGGYDLKKILDHDLGDTENNNVNKVKKEYFKKNLLLYGIKKYLEDSGIIIE